MVLSQSKKPSSKKSISGTKEWAVKNINIFKGCAHGCKYCYAQSNAVRFKRKSKENWVIEELHEKEYSRKVVKKYNGRIMFPSSHDITPNNLIFCSNKLKEILDADNEVLIVSKPHLDCITSICNKFSPFKEQILFRFTIGSIDSQILRFWEPNAPSFEERFESLKYAFSNGYKTSVSAEPILDNSTPELVEILSPYVTDAIWLGKVNRFKSCLSVNGYNNEINYKMADELSAMISDDFVLSLYEMYKEKPMIKWKDSFKKVLGLPLQEKAGYDI